MIRVFDLNINECLIVTSRIELRFALYVYNVCRTRSVTRVLVARIRKEILEILNYNCEI